MLRKHFLRKAQLAPDAANLVLKQLAQRLNQRERQILRKPSYIMMRLNGLRGAPNGYGFDDVRIQSALNQETGSLRTDGQLARLLVKHGDEFSADSLALV